MQRTDLVERYDKHYLPRRLIYGTPGLMVEVVMSALI